MPPKSKSIFRQPGARHFQLVHRSQRDPLIHDPEASTHVLKPIIKGKSRAELEHVLSPDDLAHDLDRANLGEASLYGIYYDDTEYDYMQHLREVGRHEDGVESMLIEAPTTSRYPGKSDIRGKAKSRTQGGISLSLRDLPREALPSEKELTREQVYNSQSAVPDELQGFQPDMNRHLRQTLEALEDDAFVDDSLDDDFFSELVEGGQLEGDADELNFEFREEGVDDGEETEREDQPVPAAGATAQEEDEGWEARFARFKKAHEARMKEQETGSEDLASDARSDGGDTIGQLPSIPVIGGKKRRKGTSNASGYSMSSSSMFRNEGLTLLDERFDKVEKAYESDEDKEPSDESDEAPELITSREDFNAIMDDFLNNYEIIAGKMRPVLPGETVVDKLGTIRQSLKESGYDPHEQLEADEDDSDNAFEELVKETKERWDCETVLSTYSNLENHPQLIRARETTKAPRIQLHSTFGIPSLRPDKERLATELPPEKPVRVTVARKKEESKEEKRARKQAVKEGRQARRAEKKTMQNQFAAEKRHQLDVLSSNRKGIRKL